MGAQPSNKKDALLAGSAKYFTGQPCQRGHVTTRHTNTGKCDECNRITSAEWKAKNKVRAAEISKKHYDKKAEIYRKKRIKHYYDSHEQTLANKRAHYQNNRQEKLNKNAQWRQKNADRIRELNRVYAKKNKDIVNKAAQRRRASKLQAIPPWYGELDAFVMECAFSVAQERKISTGFDWHVDHMIPLQAENVCGLHCWNNIQVIPAGMNHAKRNRLMFTKASEWTLHVKAKPA